MRRAWAPTTGAHCELRDTSCTRSLHLYYPLFQKNKTPRARGGQRWRPDSSCWSWRRLTRPRRKAPNGSALTAPTRAQRRWFPQASILSSPPPRNSRETTRRSARWTQLLKDRKPNSAMTVLRRSTIKPFLTRSSTIRSHSRKSLKANHLPELTPRRPTLKSMLTRLKLGLSRSTRCASRPPPRAPFCMHALNSTPKTTSCSTQGA
mmetsp:Transcript_29766/g.94797  ORF Transcript_29766/g.94797 Transcript_29766/m.94797 type:complete len:206 (-) Transcript_29766:576-1193(-)